MNPYLFNTQEISILPIGDAYIISVTRYNYTRNEKNLSSETTWRWETNCVELVQKLQSESLRTQVFTRQLMVLAKQFGNVEHINYKDHGKNYKLQK